MGDVRRVVRTSNHDKLSQAAMAHGCGMLLLPDCELVGSVEASWNSRLRYLILGDCLVGREYIGLTSS
jgi:hypothetical protein